MSKIKLGGCALLLIFLAACWLTFFLFALWQINSYQKPLSPAEQRAEQIILAYIDAKKLNIQLGTVEYKRMMKGILLGEYPDLTGNNSTFVESTLERDYVLDYAATHMNGRE